MGGAEGRDAELQPSLNNNVTTLPEQQSNVGKSKSGGTK